MINDDSIILSAWTCIIYQADPFSKPKLVEVYKLYFRFPINIILIIMLHSSKFPCVRYLYTVTTDGRTLEVVPSITTYYTLQNCTKNCF